MIIQGGTGNGYSAQVDDENALVTNSIVHQSQHHANHDHGTAYTMDIDGITCSSSYYLAVMKNNDDDDMIVTSVTLWVAEFKDALNIEASVGGSFTYAAGGTAVVPANVNAGSGNVADGDFYVNDGAATDISTIVAGNIAGRFLFDEKPLKWTKETSWVIPKNQCFFLKNDAANDNKWTGYISFFFHNRQLV